MKNKAEGFTLIELLVVLVILGLLAAVLAPKVVQWLDRGNHQGTTLQLTRLAGEIDRFLLDAGRYPARLDELVERPADAMFWAGPYAERSQLNDAWGRPFHYRYPGEHREFDLWSLGKDGRAGGLDADSDIRNWTED